MDLFPIYVRQGKSRTRYKVGYINVSGLVVIDPIFDDGTRYYEGLASVKVGRHWGFIDASGNFVVPPTLASWARFREGLSITPMGRKGLHAVIDKAGNVVIPAKYPYLGDFREGLALFRNGPGDALTRFGFLDRSGREVIPAVFHSAKCFSEGLAAARVRDRWGYIEHSGVFNITPHFDASRIGPLRSEDTEIGNFSQGLAYAWGANGYGFIDKTGSFVTRDDFEQADDFREDRARIRLKQQKRFGYIDLSGSIVIEPRFPSASVYFSDGVASVKEKEDRPDYSKGLASVKLDQMAPRGFIDLDGNMVIEPRFFSTQSFHSGLCLVETQKTIGYINKKGQYVWEGPYV
ncbi:MAG: WG repeat-containing protein, partial [Candidatus Sulfotelmatobacter sp.]